MHSDGKRFSPLAKLRGRKLGVAGALAGVAALGAGLAVAAGPTAAASGSGVVISEVYGGGGNSGAPYKSDFIELVNTGSSSVSLSGWSVQYHSSSGTSTSWTVTDLSGSIAAGGVYLISEAGGSTGSALPTAQASGSTNLSATAGTVALVNSQTALSTASSATAISDSQDLVGYGSTAIYEGSPTAAPSNTSSAQRTTVSGNNAADFTTAAPTPGTSTLGGSGTGTGTGTTPTLITEPDQGMTPVYNYIQSATKSIDMTMYALQDTTVEDELGTEAGKGITVRVILDSSSNEKTNNTPAYNYLKAHGVNVVWSSSAYTYTHEKSIVVDDASVAIMTLNLQPQYYSTSREFAVIDHDAKDVSAVETVFNADFAAKAVTPGDGDDLVWSPTDSQTQLLALINNAKTSLTVENEEMADTDVVNALVAAAKRGVTVKVIMTQSGDYDSEWGTLVAAGVSIHTYSESASLYIHAKVILADGARVFIGSENFSSGSLNKNRELGLITTNSSILSSVGTTLASDYAGGTAYTA